MVKQYVYSIASIIFWHSKVIDKKNLGYMRKDVKKSCFLLFVTFMAKLFYIANIFWGESCIGMFGVQFNLLCCYFMFLMVVLENVCFQYFVDFLATLMYGQGADICHVTPVQSCPTV